MRPSEFEMCCQIQDIALISCADGCLLPTQLETNLLIAKTKGLSEGNIWIE